VTLVLCTPAGDVLGVLPTFEAVQPWWPESWDAVARARELYGVDVVILRRLDAGDGERHPGGHVTYLAEVEASGAVPLTPWTGADPVADHPLRAPWARPGGPAAALEWAEQALRQLNRPPVAPPEQIRSWNLSTIWRLTTAAGPVWLKVVPPFFAHEGDMLERLEPSVVPPLLAHDGPRILLADVPGEDQYDAPLTQRLRMVRMLVRLQAQWLDRVDELVALRLPDWRNPVLAVQLSTTYERTAAELDPATRATVERLLGTLDARYADIASCGIPDTLVHGDFHPGNVRGDDDRLVLLDWGDCGVGHPLLDQPAFVAAAESADVPEIAKEWSAAWRAVIPGSDPERAAELLQPVAAMRQALIYQTFLDQIEPDEHVYHQDDPATWLRRAAAQGHP
jgi:Ser/Thr protein kinase RdoA (MazF antagonist)